MKCQNCDNEFIIDEQDKDFYKRMSVPEPTFCPDCRLQRRMTWRNERALYKRKCDKCGKDVFAIYSPNSLYNVYCHDCWWSDSWDPMTAGREYNFKKPFFEQFEWLTQKIPCINLFNGGNLINADYCNYASNVKNGYLYIGGKDVENVLYSNRLFFCKDLIDVYVSNNLELCYQDVQCEKSYHLFFSKNCENCSNSMFLYDCRNCQDCFGCTNLRNKEYHIFNKPYTKKEYLEKIKEFDTGSYSKLNNLKEKFNKVYKTAIHRYAHLVNTIDSTGDNLFNTKNCKYCFDISGKESENCKYTHYVGRGVKDSYDNYGLPLSEKLYETIAIGFESDENTDYYFSYFVKGSSRIYYSYNCISCHDLFGCVGLRNKQYCILNKQYTKEEYESLVPKIRKHMMDMPYTDSKGRIYKYGEFFPSELSPFAYNETVAQEYFPLTKEQVLENGYVWKDPEEKNIQITVKAQDLPDHIKDADDSITKQIIQCEHNGECNEQCTKAFKIISQELEFYRKMNLPLPRLCPNCRHYQRMKQRNPLRLWHRKCMCNKTDHSHKGPCSNEFETTYDPDRKEIIYCEECYKKEVI